MGELSFMDLPSYYLAYHCDDLTRPISTSTWDVIQCKSIIDKCERAKALQRFIPNGDDSTLHEMAYNSATTALIRGVIKYIPKNVMATTANLNQMISDIALLSPLISLVRAGYAIKRLYDALRVKKEKSFPKFLRDEKRILPSIREGKKTKEGGPWTTRQIQEAVRDGASPIHIVRLTYRADVGVRSALRGELGKLQNRDVEVNYYYADFYDYLEDIIFSEVNWRKNHDKEFEKAWPGMESREDFIGNGRMDYLFNLYRLYIGLRHLADLQKSFPKNVIVKRYGTGEASFRGTLIGETPRGRGSQQAARELSRPRVIFVRFEKSVEYAPGVTGKVYQRRGSNVWEKAAKELCDLKPEPVEINEELKNLLKHAKSRVKEYEKDYGQLSKTKSFFMTKASRMSCSQLEAHDTSSKERPGRSPVFMELYKASRYYPNP